jgi:thymidylate synthase, flavin-dependent|nr:MAG TPA: FAD-dependent thymidylate synthase [Caudoviricetes sp.]
MRTNERETKLHVELLAYTPEPEMVVASAAKLCYSKSDINELLKKQTPENIELFLEKLSGYGHMSPVEHISFTFGIEGISRSLSHQLVRHRLASYSQKSQRYVNEDSFKYIIPPSIKNNDRCNLEFCDIMDEIGKAYIDLYALLKEAHIRDLIDSGELKDEAVEKADRLAAEDARFVLPNACETKLIMTMNARELLHFFEERCCERAQWEIREMATQMLMIVKAIAPNIFKGAGPSCVYGKCKEGSIGCGKGMEIRSKFKSFFSKSP